MNQRFLRTREEGKAIYAKRNGMDSPFALIFVLFGAFVVKKESR